MAYQRSLPHVDPAAPQNPLRRAVLRLMSTRAMVALEGGLLYVRNGNRHRRVVLYFHDGERVTVIPSKAGLPDDPFRYQNAADPAVLFESQPFHAEAVEDEAARGRLWALADRFYPPSVAYRERAARTGRTIPILQLAPR
jgi:hypothetical protein